jgi:hypothetical protein
MQQFRHKKTTIIKKIIKKKRMGKRMVEEPEQANIFVLSVDVSAQNNY